MKDRDFKFFKNLKVPFLSEHSKCCFFPLRMLGLVEKRGTKQENYKWVIFCEGNSHGKKRSKKNRKSVTLFSAISFSLYDAETTSLTVAEQLNNEDIEFDLVIKWLKKKKMKNKIIIHHNMNRDVWHFVVRDGWMEAGGGSEVTLTRFKRWHW